MNRKHIILIVLIILILSSSSANGHSNYETYVEKMIDNGVRDLFIKLDEMLEKEGDAICNNSENSWEGYPKYPEKMLVFGILGESDWSRDNIAVYGVSGEDGSCLFKKIIYFACRGLDCSEYTIKDYLENKANQEINCEKSQSGNLIIEECTAE